jgi:Ni2+-binding GTPase involved in maturation of urease and hydrogenase
MKKLLLSLSFLLISSGGVLAADLVNKDSQAYQITITEGEQNSEISIAAGETQTTCSSDCLISVEGIGAVSAKASDVITIENGQIVLPAEQL